jgi:hypothetical protein
VKTTGFIKRILGTKKVEKNKDKAAMGAELTLRIIEVHVVEMMEIVTGMAANLEKIARGTDSLSKYFEMEIKALQKMEEVESKPPTEADYRY